MQILFWVLGKGNSPAAVGGGDGVAYSLRPCNMMHYDFIHVSVEYTSIVCTVLLVSADWFSSPLGTYQLANVFDTQVWGTQPLTSR
jgi:hypothetical protein